MCLCCFGNFDSPAEELIDAINVKTGCIGSFCSYSVLKSLSDKNQEQTETPTPFTIIVHFTFVNRNEFSGH